MARNNDLESRLIQLGKNISAASIIAPSTAIFTPDVIKAIPNLVGSENAFKPVHTQERANQWQTATEALQWSVPENFTTIRGYYEEKLINDMRIELEAVHEECSLLQEKIIQMGCVNFELEDQLKDAREKLGSAEVRVQRAEEQAEEARQNCAQQKKYQESLQSEFLAKLNVAEKEVSDLKEELNLKDEQLKGRTIENNKRNEELKRWRFAIDEIEAVNMQIQMLEKQLNNEKAAMESKWTEVRTILLERKGDMSRKTSTAESVTDGEQNTIDQFKQMMDTISDLRNALNEQTKQLELDKTERRKFKTVIRQLQADKKALLASSAMKNNNGKQQHVIQYETQLIGLQKQRDFMDHEMTLLCSLNNSKDVLIQTLQAKLEDMCSEKSELSHLGSGNDRNEDRNDRIEHSQTRIEIMGQEKSGVLNLLAKRNAGLQEEQIHARRLQMGCNKLQLQLQFSQLQQARQQIEVINSEKDLSMSEESIDGAVGENVTMEMRTQIEKFTATLRQKNIELQKVLNENEALKIKCAESTAALDLLSNELERRSQEKDNIIEMLQSQHTYLTQTILLKEKNGKQITIPPTVSQSVNVDTEPKCAMQNASTVMEKAANDLIPVVQYRETQTMTDFHFSETAKARQEQSSECLHESNQMHDNLTGEIRQLMILNAELETAIETLKGEIWTLNEQLKESLIDREDLSEKLCEFSQRHEEEIERARERERDLEEQKDMAERSQRQAALAENESNRRLVEWQEKSAQMENSRIELENSYTKLSEYYQQLQQAYNTLYARLNALKTDSNTQTIMDSNTFKISEEIPKKVEYLKSEIVQQKTELEGRTVELHLIRDLLREYLHVTLRSVRDLREMDLKLLKDFIIDDVQTVQVQLQEDLKKVHSYIEIIIVKWLEKKKLRNAEIAIAVQHLMNGTLTENISQTHDLLLSVIVDAVSKKFSEKESENAALKNDLWDERSDKAVFMEAQQSVCGREEESELKIKKLEDLLEVTQLSLAEHVIRCQQLQAKLDVLDLATDRSSSADVSILTLSNLQEKVLTDIAAAKSGSSGSDLWNCSTPCTICRELKQTKQRAPTSQLQLAILAARLTTKIADNDALFRCNAELAQTNLRLQNEVDKLREQIAKHITSSDNIGTSATNQQPVFEQRHVPKQPNQSSEQKVIHIEDQEQIVAKDLDAKSVDSSEFQVVSQQPSLNQQVIGYTTTNEVQTLNLRELEFQKQGIESLGEKFNAAREYSSKLGKENESIKSNAEKLENCLEISKKYCLELGNKMEQLEDRFTTRQHKNAIQQQKLEVSQTNDELLSLETDFMGNLNQELEELRMELRSIKKVYENEGTYKLFQVESRERLKEQKDTMKGELEEEKHKAKENDWISSDRRQHFQISLKEQLQNILENDTIQGDKIHLSQELKVQLQKNEIKMQELEKENRSLSQQLKSQQQLIEGLEKKFNVTKEYSITLEMKNLNMEQEITDQKKKYEKLMIEKGRLTEKVGDEMRKLREEIMLLKQKNGSLIVELAKKQTCLDEERANIKGEMVDFECQLTDREIVLEDLKRKLKHTHTQEESVQMSRQLDDDYGTQMNELQRKNEIDLGLDEKLVEAQKEITELKHKLGQVVKQNELLKNGEQKLMDALMISNKQLAKIESKNERLKSEISNLKASLLKAEEMAKGTDYPEKSMMENVNAMVEMHSKAATSSTMLFDSPVTIEDCYPIQKMSSKPGLQRATHYLHQNDDKLRRRKGGVSGLQGAENI